MPIDANTCRGRNCPCKNSCLRYTECVTDMHQLQMTFDTAPEVRLGKCVWYWWNGEIEEEKKDV